MGSSNYPQNRKSGESENENITCGVAKHVFEMRKNRNDCKVPEIENRRAVIQNAGWREADFGRLGIRKQQSESGGLEKLPAYESGG